MATSLIGGSSEGWTPGGLWQVGEGAQIRNGGYSVRRCRAGERCGDATATDKGWWR
jgi:hypothetical protein